MMTQPFLKPGVLRPVPICLGEIFVTAEAAVRLALQQDELPIADLGWLYGVLAGLAGVWFLVEAHRERCAGCGAREARYGFGDDENPVSERPRTLCFECFRAEIDRRQAIA